MLLKSIKDFFLKVVIVTPRFGRNVSLETICKELIYMANEAGGKYPIGNPRVLSRDLSRTTSGLGSWYKARVRKQSCPG
jgi:hypothetical protein